MNEAFMKSRETFLANEIRSRMPGDLSFTGKRMRNYKDLISAARDAGIDAANKYSGSDEHIKPGSDPAEYVRSRGYANSMLKRLLGLPVPTQYHDLANRAARAFGAGWRLRQTEIAEAMPRIPAPSVIQDTL